MHLLQVIATAISLSLVDRIGRRKALMVGIAIMGLAVLTLSIYAFHDDSVSEESSQTCREIVFSNVTNSTSSSIVNE